jgi:hypothetical protein
MKQLRQVSENWDRSLILLLPAFVHGVKLDNSVLIFGTQVSLSCLLSYNPLMGCILDERIWLRGNRLPDFSRFFVYADDAYPFALCRALNLFSEKTS